MIAKKLPIARGMEHDIQLFRSRCRRSSRGNLTRVLSDGMRITIFRRFDFYCVSLCVDGETPSYMDGTYSTEEEAIEVLIQELEADGIEW